MFYCGETIDVKDYILTVLNGAGHLWFLPMLFLCFISVWMLNRFRPNSLMTFCLFSVLSLVPARGCISFRSCPLFPLLALCLCRLSALVVQRCETVIYLCDSGIVCFNGLLLWICRQYLPEIDNWVCDEHIGYHSVISCSFVFYYKEGIWTVSVCGESQLTMLWTICLSSILFELFVLWDIIYSQFRVFYTLDRICDNIVVVVPGDKIVHEVQVWKVLDWLIPVAAMTGTMLL